MISDAQFIETWNRLRSPSRVAEALGINERSAHKRRANLVKKGWDLSTEGGTTYKSEFGWTYPRQRDLEIANGSIVVSSDHHYWPGMITLAHEALVEVVGEVKPKFKIWNGDVFDGAKVSRHPPFGFSRLPTVQEELDACKARLTEVRDAAPKDCEHYWNLGNHCVRFERTLAQHAGDFEGLNGFRLEHHFPRIEFQWSTAINWGSPSPVMIKHRWANGVHAAYNNAMKGGVTMVTGHTHALEVKPFKNYLRRYWGVQTGTISDPHGPQMEYAENAPSQATPGFVVLSWDDGNLLPPELCEVIDGKAYFRGRVVAA